MHVWVEAERRELRESSLLLRMRLVTLLSDQAISRVYGRLDVIIERLTCAGRECRIVR